MPKPICRRLFLLSCTLLLCTWIVATSKSSPAFTGDSRAVVELSGEEADLRTVRTKRAVSCDRQMSLDPIPAMGTLVLNRPDLLLSLLKTIDYPIKHFVVVHNLDSHEETNRQTETLLQSLETDLASTLGHENIMKLTVARHEDNLGFSAGVNRIILTAKESPYWLIANNDVGFFSGALREISFQMTNFMGQYAQACAWAMVGEPIGPFSTFVLTTRAVQTVGIWDENFWPVYGEDCDYEARLVRAKCPIIFESNTSRVARHIGSASWRTTGQTSSLAKLVGKGNNNFDYIQQKWGANVCDARTLMEPYIREDVGYARPFNDENRPLSYWSVDMNRRSQREGPGRCVFCRSEEFGQS